MGKDTASEHERRLDWVSQTVGHDASSLVASPRQLGYRARVRLSADGKGGLGFHPPRSHEVLTVQDCPVARPKLVHAMAELPSVPAGVSHVELRTDGEKVVAVFEVKRGAHGPIRSWANALPEDALGGADLAVDGKAVRGDCKVQITANDVSHRLSPGTFYQVNLEINDQLVRHVNEAVRARQPAHVLDAFAGAGNLSMPLAQAGLQVTQIESHPSAVRDARATAKRLGLTIDARVQRGQDFEAGQVFFDLAIIDPPRSGAGAMMQQILTTRPKALIMVSCNPHTLTRDVRQAKDAGYSLSELHVYEMFPQTEHAEVLAVLDR